MSVEVNQDRRSHPLVWVEVMPGPEQTDTLELVHRALGLGGRLPLVVASGRNKAWLCVYWGPPLPDGPPDPRSVELMASDAMGLAPCTEVAEAWREAGQTGAPGDRLAVLRVARALLEQAIEQLLVPLPAWLLTSPATLERTFYREAFLALPEALADASPTWTGQILDAACTTMAGYLEWRFPGPQFRGPGNQLQTWESEVLEALARAVNVGTRQDEGPQLHSPRHLLSDVLVRLGQNGHAPARVPAGLIVNLARPPRQVQGRARQGVVVDLQGVRTATQPIWLPDTHAGARWGVCSHPHVGFWVRAVLGGALSLEEE
jgi:hypothetical protein